MGISMVEALREVVFNVSMVAVVEVMLQVVMAPEHVACQRLRGCAKVAPASPTWSVAG